MKRSAWWAGRAFGQKLALLAAAALVLAMAAETLHNLQAISTQGLQPVSLAVADFTFDEKAPVAMGENGLTVTAKADKDVYLRYEALDTPLTTVCLTLGGQGAVQASFLATDQAVAYDARMMYTVTCLTQDPALRTCYAYVHSTGKADTLVLQLTSPSGQPYTVESVTVNTPVPVVYQPLRIGLYFAAALALLCALFLRGMAVRCDFRRRSHRLIVVLPLVALMVLSTVLAAAIVPQKPLLQGRALQDCAGDGTDAYAALFAALAQGRLALDITPAPELLALSNPYDYSERVFYDVPFLHDFVLYQNQYYVYFGLAPILTVYAPFYLLTGRVPASRDAALVLAIAAIALIGWAVCGLQRRYAKGANIFALSLCCVTAVLAAGVLMLLASADMYYIAVLSYVCFFAGALAAGLHAPQAGAPWRRRALYAVSGLCFALTAMSRAHAAPMLFAMLTPLFIGDLAAKKAKGWDAAAFLLPAVAGLGLMLAYNALRFGNPFEFGASHQLTVADIRTQRATLFDLPQALYTYLLYPVRWVVAFPYVSLTKYTASAVGHQVYTDVSFGILTLPIVWALLLFPLHGLPGDADGLRLRRERGWALLAPLAVSLPLMLLSFGMAGVLIRYVSDYFLIYALAGIACALPVMSRFDTPERKALAVACAGLCVATVVLGALLVFRNERSYLVTQSPAIYYGLQRMFFPFR